MIENRAILEPVPPEIKASLECVMSPNLLLRDLNPFHSDQQYEIVGGSFSELRLYCLWLLEALLRVICAKPSE
jgi:hypothetical protein